MPEIIPIRDLKNTSAISERCRSSNEPIFVTKNGYGDMVIMSVQTYERKLLQQEVLAKIAQAEQDIACGRVADAQSVLEGLRRKYDV